MGKYAIMIADGCEEVEAIAVIDLLRRARIDVDLINIHDREEVTSSHKITFKTDIRLSDMDKDGYEGIILPGGLVGTNNLKANETVTGLLQKYNSEGKLVSAICAAPTALAAAGVLEGKKATCYPGCEKDLTGAEFCEDEVVVSGNAVTSRGMGTAVAFGLALITYILGKEKSEEIRNAIVYKTCG